MPPIARDQSSTTIFMSRGIFVDTGAWIALANKGDRYHLAAVKGLEEIQTLGLLLVTSNFVLDETYTRIRRQAGLKAVVTMGEKIQESKQVKTVTVDRSTEKKAWEIFKKYADQPFSYTDCVSFALMREKRITQVFAFDKDFQVMGFSLMPSL